MSCYVPHLYDAQPRHVKPEPAPVFTAERVTDDHVPAILGAWLVAFPVLLAALEVIM